jgi:ribosomal protein S18 acetylase RimI-like enzyme
MGSVIIREALPGEMAAVGDLRAAAYAAGGFLSTEYAPELRALGSQGDGVVLVASDLVASDLVASDLVASAAGGGLTGTIMLVLPPCAGEIIESADEAEIRALAVAPGTQRGGVGAALVTAALGQAAAGGARRVVLSTLPQMHAAHRLYERAGFRRLPGRDWYPRPGVTLLAYSLDLPAPGSPAPDSPAADSPAADSPAADSPASGLPPGARP